MELKELSVHAIEGEEDNPAKNDDDRPLLESDTSVSFSNISPVSHERFEELERKCAAYVRSDVYGTNGMGKLPLFEKVCVGFSLLTLVPIRFVLGMVVVLIYYLVCRICTLFSEPNPDEDQGDYGHMVGWRRTVIVRCGRFLSRAMLFVMGFYWINETFTETINCEHGEEFDRPGVIISNHVSYLDILYHMSSSFPSFVAKKSVSRLPLVGLISKCLGCVYVQREAKTSDKKGVSGVITDRIQNFHQNNHSPMLMLFPEGTTTNGNFLLPFKTGAFIAKLPVLPVLLRYPYKRFSPSWDSISGGFRTINPLQFINNMEDNFILFHNYMQGNLLPSDIGLAEKRIYHAALNGLFSQC